MKGLSLHLTDLCNQSCKFCVVDSYKEKKESVNLKLIYSFLEDNANKGFEIVNIHGGEATILEEFIPILERINELGYPEISLQTNAKTLCDFEFAKKLVQLNVKTFVVSFHTLNPKELAWLADVDENWWFDIVDEIKNLKSLGVQIRTNTVIYNNNKNEIQEILEFLIEELKITHINISNMHPAGRAYKNFDAVCPKLTEIIPSVKKAVDYATNKTVTVTLEGFPPCLLNEYTKYIVDWENTKFKMLFHNFILPNYADFMSRKTKILGPNCNTCIYKNHKLCGGLYKEYVENFGISEFSNIPEITEEY